MPTKHLIVVVGPTAAGKTAAAIAIAQRYGCPILSGDARQFYTEMTIGVARPSTDELKSAKHYFIASHSVHAPLTAGQFEDEALALLDTLYQTHDVVVLVGGSGLYINTLVFGADDIPTTPDSIRNYLNTAYETHGLPWFINQLKDIDPPYLAVVDVNNPRRVMRGLEVYLTTGQPYSSFRTGVAKPRPFTPVWVGINLERDELYNRINTRVDSMMNAGLLKEAEGLYPHKNLNALQTVGYTELFAFFDGQLDLPQAVEKIKQNSRNYAKRQLTWFNKNKAIAWFAPTQSTKMIDYIATQLI